MGRDATRHTTVSSAASAVAVAVFFVVFAGFAVVLLVGFANGVVRVWRSGADLGRVDEVEGAVVKVLPEGVWFAVDPGTADHVRAWHPGAARLPVLGSTVRVSVTRHLGYVTAISVLAPPPVAPTPPTVTAPAGGVEPAVSWVAPGAAGAGASGRPAGTIDAAAVRAATGLDLPEVDPSTVPVLGSNVPPGAAVRAFSDGTNQVLVGTVPPDAPEARAAGSLPEGGGRERWVAGQLLLQHGPAGLVAVEVSLPDRSSEQRHQIARGSRLAPPPR